jgi:hypothetical protein
MPARRVRNPDEWVMVAVAKDDSTIESWQRDLEAAGIESEVRLGDPAMAGITVGAARGYVSPVATLVSFPLYVRARDRRAARTVLAQSPELEGPSIDRNAVIGAVAVVGATVLGVLVILLRD